MTDPGFAEQLKGFSLTTAEILYRMPDHPSLLQTFIWQEYDQHPNFPKLQGFLNFWTDNIEGRLFRIRVAHKQLISPAELRMIGGEFVLN
ncbi:MAG: usg protein [Alphaproteobacteria bacterium]|nr:usg protein [Alphaproteobacteria bacterium]